jgi:hypothetical protein
VSTDADLRTSLQRLAAEFPTAISDPEPLVRRARRRAARTMVVGALGVVVAVIAAFGSVSILRSSPPVPAVPSPLPPILLEGEVLESHRGWMTALDPATGERRRIVRTGCDFQDEECNTFLFRHALSADGTWLAYDLWTCVVSAPCDPEAGLWVTNALGERHQLTFLCDPPGSCLDEEWAWSPQGATLAAYGGEVGGRLVTIDPSTGEPTAAADPNIRIEALAWSPESERLAYVTGSTVYVADLATGRSTRTVDGLFETIISMAWSPDGTRLVLEDGLGDGRILVADLDGSEPRVLVDRESDQPPAQPMWSPDGTRIAYFAMPNGGFELWVIGADGGDATRVFHRDEDCCALTNEFPTWSPDGTRIAVFGHFGPGGPSYVALNADGSGTPEPIEALEVQDWRSGG